MDQLVGAFGVFGTALTLSTRWHDYSISQRFSVLANNSAFLLIFLVARYQPRAWAKHRTAALLILKGVAVLLPGLRVQVRLNREPSGRLVADLFATIMGKGQAPVPV